MSKSLLTAKVVGGGILGTGAVAAGGYGIVEHFRSKESTVDTTSEKDSGDSRSTEISQPNEQVFDSSESTDTTHSQQQSIPSEGQDAKEKSQSTVDNAPSVDFQVSEQRDSDKSETTTETTDKNTEEVPLSSGATSKVSSPDSLPGGTSDVSRGNPVPLVTPSPQSEGASSDPQNPGPDLKTTQVGGVAGTEPSA